MILVKQSTNSSKLFAAASLAALLIHAVAAPVQAVVPSDNLMSVNTRGFASIADIRALQQHWQQTQMGQLVQDEAMRPFVEDMKKQLQRKITGFRDKLGIELEDLRDIAGGEIGFGLIERENDRAAVALTVDVTGHRQQLDEFLEKVDKELTKRNATQSVEDLAGVSLTSYDIPPKDDTDIRRTALYFIKDNMFCASDNRQEIQDMLRHFDGQGGGRLADLKTYQETSSRCAKEAAGLEPEIHWFVDPFGYARSVRSMDTSGKKHAGKDYLRILSEQGFEAIQGIGGFVNLAVGGSFELLHRTSVYAPPIPGAPNKYNLAMRMMEFPNSPELEAKKWVPRKLASYRTFNCDLANAFEHFDTLFDAVAGYEDAFDGVLEGLERDPYGPQIKVKEDFVAHLGQRVMMITDYEVPITPKCERFMFVVELTNEKAVAATIQKYMESDPNASKTEFQGKTFWEIREVDEEVPDLDIDVADLDLLDSLEETGGNNINLDVPTSAVCITESHFFYASHTEFLKEIFTNNEDTDTLKAAGDYREVDSALKRLLTGPASARSFLRTDEVTRPIYELLRQGKMPESETLLGRILNRLFSSPDEEEEGILREQKIDGRKLPEFEMVRRYFGPAGNIVRSNEDGWFIVGATLSKMAPQANASNSISAEISTVR